MKKKGVILRGGEEDFLLLCSCNLLGMGVVAEKINDGIVNAWLSSLFLPRFFSLISWVLTNCSFRI